MRRKAKFSTAVLATSLGAIAFAALAHAQAPAAGGRGGRGGGFANAYPTHAAADPGTIARGKQAFDVNCSFCHGNDARGGEGGPNLLRSELVLSDDKGELIAPIVGGARIDKGMPKIDLPMTTITDIAGYIHSLAVTSRDPIRKPPTTILVGDAAAGKAFFDGAGKCSTCHSVTGDLAGIGGKYDPKTLQNALVAGQVSGGRGAAPTSAVPPTTAKITLASGEVVEGKLDRIDDFDVSVVMADGTRRSFRRNGDVPKVEVTNPLRAHINMLRTLTDDQIHNLTSYLVTLK